MSYNRSETVDPSAGGDTVKQAVLDLDSDMDNIFTYLNAHELLTTGAHGITGTIVGTSEAQTLTNKTLTSPVINTGVSGTAFLDEDNMASDSANKIASQQSIKAYVDTHTALTAAHGAGAAVVGTTDAQTLTNKTLTSPVLNTGISGTAFLDEDNMASNSATKVASQQSIKAYVDDVDSALTTHKADTSTHGIASAIVGTTEAQTLTNKTLTSPVLNTGVSGTAIKDQDDMASNSATHLATQQSIKAYVDTLRVGFSVKPTSEQANIALDTSVTVIFGTEIFDLGGDFAANTFTAPVTGKYHFDLLLQLLNVDSGATSYTINLVTTARVYNYKFDSAKYSGDPTWLVANISVLADMASGHTAYVYIYQTGGFQQTDISPGSWFSGYLVGS